MKILFLISALLLSFLGLTKQAFATTCTDLQSVVPSASRTYHWGYASESSALAGCEASPVTGYGNCWTVSEDVSGYHFFAVVRSHFSGVGWIFWVVCDLCSTQKQSKATECGGIDKVQCNDQCVCSCIDPCAQQKQAKVTECGGLDKVQCDDQCICSCISSPISPQCAQQYESLCVSCGSCNNITSWSNLTCSGNCQNCSHAATDAAATCGAGRYTLNQTDCSFSCKNCNQLNSDCELHCNSLGSYVVRTSCSQNAQSIVTSAECVCGDDQSPPCTGDSCPSVPDPSIPDPFKTCDELRSACSPACSFVCTSGSDGFARSQRCDCSTPSSNPQTPSDTPSSNPVDGDDTNGWLGSIKSNTDTLVEQGNDVKSWLGSVKDNSDRQLGLTQQGNTKLDNIAQNQARTTDNLNVINRNMGVYSGNEVNAVREVRDSITGPNGTNSLLGGVNSNLNSANSKLNTLIDGLNDTSIGTTDSSSLNSLGGGDEVTGVGYGAVGTTGLLPSSDSIRSAFGTYAPTGSGYVGIARSSFSRIVPEVSQVTCSSTLHLPYPTLSGIEWRDYPFDLCPYEQYISMIGNALVFLTALFELFKLAS